MFITPGSRYQGNALKRVQPAFLAAINQTVERNVLLNGATLAKATGIAAYLRNERAFMDGYAGSDGIKSGSSSNYTVDTSNKLVKPSTNTSTAGTNIGDLTGNGGLAAAFNGNTNQASSACAFAALSTGVHAYVGKNFTTAIGIASVTFYTATDQGLSANGAVSCTVTLRGMHTAPSSASDAGSTSLGSVVFTDSLSQQNKTITSNDAVTKWEYLWLDCAPGGTNPNCNIAEMQITVTPTNLNMTVVTLAQIPYAAPNWARIVAEIQASLTPTTDITAEASFDNESTYYAGALTLIGATTKDTGTAAYLYDTGYFRIPSTGIAGVLARIKTLTNKAAPITRLGFGWAA